MVAGLMVVLVVVVVMLVVVMMLVVMYKLWAQEQQLAAPESNANPALRSFGGWVSVNDSNTLWNNADRETLKHSMYVRTGCLLSAV